MIIRLFETLHKAYVVCWAVYCRQFCDKACVLRGQCVGDPEAIVEFGPEWRAVRRCVARRFDLLRRLNRATIALF